MGLANWLTLLRILLIPVFVSLLVYRRPGAALIVFGKAATFFQVLAVLTGLLARFFQFQLAPRSVVWLAAGFTILSGLQYIIQGMRFLNASPGVEREESPENALYR